MNRAARGEPGVRFPVLMLVVAGVTTVFALIGAEPLIRAVLLDRYGRTADAEVTRADVVEPGRRSIASRYVLEYRFRPPRADRWYTHTDIVSHAPSHVGVSRAVWEDAQRRRLIRVIYVPSRPSINRPADHPALDGLFFPALVAGFLALIAGSTWVTLLKELNAYRRGRPRDHDDHSS